MAKARKKAESDPKVQLHASIPRSLRTRFGAYAAGKGMTECDCLAKILREAMLGFSVSYRSDIPETDDISPELRAVG